MENNNKYYLSSASECYEENASYFMADICFCFDPIFLLLLVNAICREKTYFAGKILSSVKW